MNTVRIAGVGMVVGIVALLVTSCAKPPVAEKATAQAARDKAITVQAEAYTTKTLSDAKVLWEDAEAKMLGKAYVEAKAVYLAAKVEFDKAVSEAEAVKLAMTTENQTRLAELEKRSQELTAAADKKAKKLQAELKSAWMLESKKIEETLAAARENVLSPTEINAKLAEAKALVEKWLESFTK